MIFNKEKHLLGFIVSIQLIVLSLWYAKEAEVIGSSSVPSIEVATAPLDPRDLLSGQYFRLNYPFSRIEETEVWESLLKYEASYQVFWLGFKKEGNLYVAHKAFASKKQAEKSGLIFIRGLKEGRRATYNIERFYVAEGTPEPDRSQTTVVLKVPHSGLAKIKALKVNGKNYP